MQTLGLHENLKFFCIPHPIAIDTVIAPGRVVAIEIAGHNDVYLAAGRCGSDLDRSSDGIWGGLRQFIQLR